MLEEMLQQNAKKLLYFSNKEKLSISGLQNFKKGLHSIAKTDHLFLQNVPKICIIIYQGVQTGSTKSK